MGNEKSICIVITNDLLTDQRIQKTRKSLLNAGYSVTVFYRLKSDEDGIENEGLKGVKMWFGNGPLFYLEFNIRASFYLLFNSFDIITSVDIDTIMSCRMVAWIKGSHLVFDAHEYFLNVPELAGKRIKKGIWTLVEKLFVRGLSGAYTVNKSLADIFTERYKTPFTYVRNVSESSSSDISLKSIPVLEPCILIYQGAINEGRGVELYIKAVESIENCVLWIIGMGDLYEEIKTMANQSNAKDRIELKGFVPPESLLELTRKAHIGLNMLDPSSTSYFYSLANRYYDYIRAGIPAINMDFPEYRSANEQFNTGILIAEYSVESLISALNEIIGDPDRYQEMSSNCRSAIAQNNWEKEAEKLITIYNEI